MAEEWLRRRAATSPSPLAKSSGTGRLSLCEPRTIAKPPEPGAWSHSWSDTASSEVQSWPFQHRYCSSGLNLWASRR